MLVDALLALMLFSCYVLAATGLALIGMWVFKRKYGIDLLSDEDDE